MMSRLLYHGCHDITEFHHSEKCPCFHLGLDGDRQTEGTDTSRKRDARSSAGHHKSEDTSDSREDDATVSDFISSSLRLLCLITPTRPLFDKIYANVHMQTQPFHISQVTRNKIKPSSRDHNLHEVLIKTGHRKQNVYFVTPASRLIISSSVGPIIPVYTAEVYFIHPLNLHSQYRSKPLVLLALIQIKLSL